MSKAKREITKLRFPTAILQEINKYKGNGILISRKVFNWTWDNIKQANVNRLDSFKSKNPEKEINIQPSFILFPNFEGLFFCKIEEKSTIDNIMIYSKSIKEGVDYFIDSQVRVGVEIKNKVTLPCYTYHGIINKIYSKIYSTIRLIPSRTYIIKALLYNVPIGKVGENIIESKYIIFEASEKKEDFTKIKGLKFNSIHDISLMWNYNNDTFVWDEIETAIILCNAFYMELNIPALNLILCGKTEAKKTPWITLLSLIFGDSELSSAQFTDKSLVPSFFGKEPKFGALLESSYITLLDDFLRYYDQLAQKNRTSKYFSLATGLGQIFNILDRCYRKFPSGKFDVEGQYSASFFATDNMKYKDEMKQLWLEDKAIVRRFSFLVASKKTEERGSHAYMETEMAINKFKERLVKVNMTIEKYRLLGLYLRERMQLTKTNEKVINDMNERIKTLYKQDFNMITKIRAIYKFCICIKEFIPSFPDNMFEDMVFRLAGDFYEVCIK